LVACIENAYVLKLFAVLTAGLEVKELAAAMASVIPRRESQL